MKYTLLVDYGKPYEEQINTDKELKKELAKLRHMALTEDYAYFDINVLNDKGEDITKTKYIQAIFKEAEE